MEITLYVKVSDQMYEILVRHLDFNGLDIHQYISLLILDAEDSLKESSLYNSNL